VNSVTETDFAQLSRAGKMQILQWLVKDLSNEFPGIKSRPQVCVGTAYVVSLK
jgi:hypothetical protein